MYNFKKLVHFYLHSSAYNLHHEEKKQHIKPSEIYKNNLAFRKKGEKGLP